MDPEISIRKALSSDAEAIAYIARITWNDVYADIILPENRERLLARWYAHEAIREAIGRENSWVFVAQAGDELVGFAQFAIRRDGDGQLTRIYVLPDWQRRSAGTALLQAGVAVLAGSEVDELYVEVEKENHLGKSFYERQGFRFTREFELELPDQSLMLEEMVLPLREDHGSG